MSEGPEILIELSDPDIGSSTAATRLHPTVPMDPPRRRAGPNGTQRTATAVPSDPTDVDFNTSIPTGFAPRLHLPDEPIHGAPLPNRGALGVPEEGGSAGRHYLQVLRQTHGAPPSFSDRQHAASRREKDANQTNLVYVPVIDHEGPRLWADEREVRDAATKQRQELLERRRRVMQEYTTVLPNSTRSISPRDAAATRMESTLPGPSPSVEVSPAMTSAEKIAAARQRKAEMMTSKANEASAAGYGRGRTRTTAARAAADRPRVKSSSPTTAKTKIAFGRSVSAEKRRASSATAARSTNTSEEPPLGRPPTAPRSSSATTRRRVPLQQIPNERTQLSEPTHRQPRSSSGREPYPEAPKRQAPPRSQSRQDVLSASADVLRHTAEFRKKQETILRETKAREQQLVAKLQKATKETAPNGRTRSATRVSVKEPADPSSSHSTAQQFVDPVGGGVATSMETAPITMPSAIPPMRSRPAPSANASATLKRHPPAPPAVLVATPSVSANVSLLGRPDAPPLGQQEVLIRGLTAEEALVFIRPREAPRKARSWEEVAPELLGEEDLQKDRPHFTHNRFVSNTELDQFRRRWTLNHCVTVWRRKCELRSVEGVATDIRRRSVLRLWRRRLAETTALDNVITQFQQRTVITRWRARLVELQAARAGSMRIQGNSLGRLFDTWKAKTRVATRLRFLNAQADAVVLRRIWSQWQEAKLVSEFDRRRRRRLVLGHWWSRYQSRQASRVAASQVTAVQTLKRHAVEPMWRAYFLRWLGKAQTALHRQRVLDVQQHHRRRLVIRHCFYRWQSRSNSRRSVRLVTAVEEEIERSRSRSKSRSLSPFQAAGGMAAGSPSTRVRLTSRFESPQVVPPAQGAVPQ